MLTSVYVLRGVFGDEEKRLRKIVDFVLDKMVKVPLRIDTFYFKVGLDKQLLDLESMVVSSTESEGVRIVGIVGVGGAGKTTLANKMYNEWCSSFSRSSWLPNVRDAATTNNLHNLQRNLVWNLCNDRDEATGIISHSFYPRIQDTLASYSISNRVLIVLDNVDDVDQMRALLPPQMMHNLGKGSLIIVTTREKNVLQAFGRNFSIYEMQPLDPVNAQQLFRRHALSADMFDPSSQHGFEDLIGRFVEACSGLPLFLKFFGAMVKGRSMAYWESVLRRISTRLPNQIADSLKLWYDELDPQVQQMFLDVACFFIREDKSRVVATWDGCGWNGERGWDTLINEHLIELNEFGSIHMDDRLRDMGRQIARDTSPSRIWTREQMSMQGGRTPIRGIMVGDPWSLSPAFAHSPQPLEYFNFTQLQLLSVWRDDFREEYVASSKDLVFLRVVYFNGTNLPSWLSMAKLRFLDLNYAQNLEELWHENVQPPLQLRLLSIHFGGNRFNCLPRSIGRLKHLKTVSLRTGSGMSRLPEEFCDLESLDDLRLYHFPKLSSLPDDFGKLRNLRSLTLYEVELMALPDSFKELTALKTLHIFCCHSLMFTAEMLELMTELEDLCILRCPRLEELPHLTTQVSSLRSLRLPETRLRELPNYIGQLTKLQALEIGSSNLTILPGSLGKLSGLTYLTIGDCTRLESLPETIGRLSNLQSLIIYNTPVKELGLGKRLCDLRSLKHLSLRNTGVCQTSISDHCCPNLEALELFGNKDLTAIQHLPKNVKKITVHWCEKIWNMMGVSDVLNLEILDIFECPNLIRLSIPRYMFSLERRIRIGGCPNAAIDIFDDDGHIETVKSDDGRLIEKVTSDDERFLDL